MLPKVIFAFGFVVAVIGAPRAIHFDNDLRTSVVEFLKQDPTFLLELDKAKMLGDIPNPSVASERHRRQAELDEVENQTDDGSQQNEGFFDRAAKFVVDLLQRFLKWINSDNN